MVTGNTIWLVQLFTCIMIPRSILTPLRCFLHGGRSLLLFLSPPCPTLLRDFVCTAKRLKQKVALSYPLPSSPLEYKMLQAQLWSKAPLRQTPCDVPGARRGRSSCRRRTLAHRQLLVTTGQGEAHGTAPRVGLSWAERNEAWDQCHDYQDCWWLSRRLIIAIPQQQCHRLMITAA